MDWDDYAGMDTEHRLGRMTWQVCECDAVDRVYGLRLPGTELAPNQGLAHRQAVLRRLALYGIDQDVEAFDETILTGNFHATVCGLGAVGFHLCSRAAPGPLASLGHGSGGIVRPVANSRVSWHGSVSALAA